MQFPRESNLISLDTETTGLYPYKGDRIFAISLFDGEKPYYYDFRDSGLSFETQCLNNLKGLLADEQKTLFIHNAKFDMHHLAEWSKSICGREFEFKCKILDTQVLARLYQNDRLSYSLDSCAKEDLKIPKDDAVKIYLRENKLKDQYHLVPKSIMQPYAETDARICFQLGMFYLDKLEKLDQQYTRKLSPPKSIMRLVDVEEKFTKVLYKMERTGVIVDEAYTRTANLFEETRANKYITQFEQITGRAFVDSGKALYETFSNIPGDSSKIVRTAKGNPSFTDEVLSSFTSPAAVCVKEYRAASKKAGTYYSNFIELRGKDGRIHTNFRQAGTGTGRLSCSDPNLQNINKEEDLSDPRSIVRKCFIPPHNWNWVSIDYQAQEFRMLLDSSGEVPVIKKVLGGADVHQATADMMRVTRKEAKTVNFGLLYGMGQQKLADTLGVSVDRAKNLKNNYFSTLPKISIFTKAISRKAEQGLISNWAGRIYRFQRDFAYKAVNYVIQGGCSDVLRFALIEMDRFIEENELKSKIILTVHDEICLYMPDEELVHIPKLQEIMSNAYPHSLLPLTTEVSISKKSWAEVEKYNGTKAGNYL